MYCLISWSTLGTVTSTEMILIDFRSNNCEQVGFKVICILKMTCQGCLLIIITTGNSGIKYYLNTLPTGSVRELQFLFPHEPFSLTSYKLNKPFSNTSLLTGIVSPNVLSRVLESRVKRTHKMKKPAFSWCPQPPQIILGNSLENMQRILTVLSLKNSILLSILLSTENIAVYFF